MKRNNNNKTSSQKSFEQTLRKYASIYNGVTRNSFSESEQEIVHKLFATKVSVVAGDTMSEVDISQLKHLLQGFLQAGRNCKIVHFEWLDDRHVEYKTHITGPNGFESMDHSIATINKQNKIVSIEPFSQDGTARILFQIKFRDYFALYDGSPSTFGAAEKAIFDHLFSPDFQVTIDDRKYNHQEWMQAVKNCIEGGMKVDILEFAFAPNSTETFEYKLRVVSNKNDEGAVVLHSVGFVMNGKFASFIPHSDKAYQTVFPSSSGEPKSNDSGKKKNVVAKKRKSRSKRRGGFRLWVPAGWDRKGFGMV
jgi:hypothetical protein